MSRKWPMALGMALSLMALGSGLAAGTTDQQGWHLAARWTARASFPIFLLTYLASSLVRLQPAPWSRAIARDRRWWGLGFAASHTVHLVALIMALSLDPEPRTPASLIPGGTAYVFILAMALTSSSAAMRALGRNWKRLHSAGIHVIWLIFALAYAKRIPAPETRAIGLTMTMLALTALLLRMLARRRRGARAFA
ncbi:hypothetical protein [Novosphingobium sp. B1]|uniref:hypothetical protein n=1 Tax=Novosphingobium sp. B1 TaxID=1938756 RepID=UPI0009D89A20|nr:hypothetical protein [Novosphingobium sp. B1]SMC91321.1 DMSO/TMAO reductase YedYZ, heme-binding membrane subunit [Novosphingobium sp. B1]